MTTTVDVYRPKRAMPKGHDGLSNRFQMTFSCTKNMGMGQEELSQDIYTTTWRGTLEYIDDVRSEDDDVWKPSTRRTTVAGKIHCTMIHRGNIVDRGANLQGGYGYLLDPVDQELHEVGVLLDLIEEEDEISHGDCLYVNEVHVVPAFKGLGLGLFMVDMADKTINSSMSLLVLQPFPLQFMRRTEADKKWAEEGPSLEDSTKKLVDYYGLIGRDVHSPHNQTPSLVLRMFHLSPPILDRIYHG